MTQRYQLLPWFLFFGYCACVHAQLLQSCLTLCNPMHYSPPGILQARILERVAMPSSRGSFQPRNPTEVFCTAGGFFTTKPPWKFFGYCHCSVTQLCPALCDPVDCSMPGFPVHHQLLELTQTHVHRTGDAIQPSRPLLSPSPSAFNLF